MICGLRRLDARAIGDQRCRKPRIRCTVGVELPAAGLAADRIRVYTAAHPLPRRAWSPGARQALAVAVTYSDDSSCIKASHENRVLRPR